jgi:ABC-type antimicrobial peptide transport system permease subunit
MRWTTLQAIRLAAIGMALGIVGAWVAAGGLEDLVFGISPRSVAALIASGLSVLLIAGLAAAIPAWRASRVDVASQLHQG